MVFGDPLEREAEDDARSFSCGLLPGDGEARPDIVSNSFFESGNWCGAIEFAMRVSAEVCDKSVGRLLRRLMVLFNVGAKENSFLRRLRR